MYYLFICYLSNKKISFCIPGSDCYNLFKTMQSCMQRYPTLYNKDLGDDEDLGTMDKMDSSNGQKSETLQDSPK